MHLIAPPGTSIEKERQSEIQSEGNEKECSTWPLAVKLSWTTMHVIDHKMFIAARRIQSYWRAYRIRNLLHRRWHAAVVIQRWWRGFRIRRILWELVERRLQHALYEHFNQAAIRIQALFRGWQDRRYVHDVQNLHGMQTSAAEELISCFILQFHQIKKTESLPGLFSLRNSVCLPKVEKLMATMVYRFHNGRVLSMVANMMTQKEDHRKYFESARFRTQLPYAGPNVNQMCHITEEDKVEVKDLTIDRRYAQIVAEYEESQLHKQLRDSHRRSKTRKVQGQLGHIKSQEMAAKRKFCADVKDRLLKWKLRSGADVNIDKIFLQSPGVEFLNNCFNMEIPQVLYD